MVESNRIMVNNMGKNKQHVNKMMIAFYQRPYSPDSTEKIKRLLDEKRPDELLLLTIAERKQSSGTVDSYLGRKDVEQLRDQYEKDQEIRSTNYADKILTISKKKGISTKKLVKKGTIYDVIKKEMEEYHPDIIVLNHTDKSRLDKLISGCIEDELISKCNNNIIVV
jgi:nucleotide-binding universal stress UspA family protein